MSRTHRPDRALSAAALVALALAAGAGWAARTGHPPAASAFAAVVEQDAVLVLTQHPSPLATADCVEQRTAEVVSGTGPGGATDGPSAILAFHRGYFHDRSGQAVRAVVAEDASLPPVAAIQAGINATPAGTRYCVHVRPGDRLADGPVARWKVALTVQYPSEQPKVLGQTVTTRYHAGRTLITAITKS